MWYIFHFHLEFINNESYNPIIAETLVFAHFLEYFLTFFAHFLEYFLLFLDPNVDEQLD